MTVRYLPKLDPDKWYVITGGGDRQYVSLHGPNCEASAEWSLLPKKTYRFGYGVIVGRNGSESDVGVDLYAGRLGSLWLRLRTPWTKFARISKESGDPRWYQARHYGVKVLAGACLIDAQWNSPEHESGGRWSLYTFQVWGPTTMAETEGATGRTHVPTPEGLYEATYRETTSTWTHGRFPGTLRDRFRPVIRHSYEVKVEGGIPVEGKGENSWDCGMDGVFAVSGPTLSEAVEHYTRSVERDRARYGGPHHLTRPMTVAEASS